MSSLRSTHLPEVVKWYRFNRWPRFFMCEVWQFTHPAIASNFPVFYCWFDLEYPVGHWKDIDYNPIRSKSTSLAKMKQICTWKFVPSSNVGRHCWCSNQSWIHELGRATHCEVRRMLPGKARWAPPEVEILPPLYYRVQRRELGEVDPTPPGIILLFPLYYYYGVQRREAGEVDHTPPGTR